MLFDHLKQTEEELIGHVKAACAALTFLREVDPYEALKPGPLKEQWQKHMHALNTARTQLGMASEYLQDDLNQFNDELIAASDDSHKAIIEG
jgi:hypothetical protein